MDWLAQNWVWVVISVLFIGMHLFGHGSHGGGGCGGHGSHGDGDKQRAPADQDEQGVDRPQGHHH